ncbi:MAG: hypothetical protein Kow0074_01120 [Candidatus Zixiibacteriota bacterium]
MTMRIGLQKRAIAGMSLLLMALAVSLMWISVYQGSDQIRSELLKRGHVAAVNLAYNATYPTIIRDTSALGDFLDGIMAEKEVLYCGIFDKNDESLVERLRPAATLFASQILREDLPEDKLHERLRQGVARMLARSETREYYEERGMVYFHVPIQINHRESNDLGSELRLYGFDGNLSVSPGPERRDKIGAAVIGMTTHYIEETIADLRDKMIWITAIAILITMLIVSVVVRVSIQPINELVVATGRVADGDYDCKVAEGRNDEIGDLARSFNTMTADLKKSRDALVEKELLEALVVELRETQEQLVQAGKLAALGQLAAGVAHEINNPLAGIMGYAQLLTEKLRRREVEGIAPEEVPKLTSYVENMEKQSQRCKQIVQNLLKFARASSKEDMVEVDINNVIKETLALVDHQLSQSNIVLETHYSDDLPPIRGQEGKLQQVITNIVINAMQAIEDQGKIIVSSERDGDRVLIQVTDNGVGIPEENLDKVFEPFFTTKELGRGTGLGLSVTYGLVHDMGGEISIDSTVGVGTTFTVSFPVASAEPVCAAPRTSTIERSSRPIKRT